MLKIVHFSDIHITAPLGSAKALFDKRIVGFLNGAVFRRRVFRREYLERAIPMMLEEKPDVFVFTGDATTCSQPEEFETALELLKPLIESGIPILYTPGNHDCYVPAKECVEALRKFRLALTGSAETPAKFETPECDFLIFNSVVPTSPMLSCGFFAPESLEFLKKECEQKTKPIIMLSHFPVMNTEKGIAGARRKLYDAEPVRDLSENGEIDLILCGHLHTPYEMLDFTGRGESGAGSLTKKGIYRTILFADNMFHTETKYVQQ